MEKSMDLIDKAKSVRQGDELDAAKVEAFIKNEIPGLTGSLEVEQFSSGYSNLTYLLRMGDREFVLRRPPFGTKAATAHDMNREYTIQKRLKPVFPYCPKVFAYTEDPAVIGSPFYIMERVRGIILRKDLPEGLTFTEDQARMLCEKLLDVHLELHGIDYEKAGLGDFGKPAGYVRRQVEGWSKRYRKARTPDAPDFEVVMAWLAENMPPDTDRPTVIHNDYRFDNVVLDPADPMRIIAVLDWEMATIGDPLMDLGNSLAYWIQADDPPETQMMRLLPTTMPGALTRRRMAERYAEKSGRSIENFNWYLCFGLFRLAVIAQQIYYRFFHGQTTNEKFRMLVFGVHLLEKSAGELIEK
jgi:aminoglycoside phosphotransferase (APT) family kinase protein